jgi:hypothetical protein
MGKIGTPTTTRSRTTTKAGGQPRAPSATSSAEAAVTGGITHGRLRTTSMTSAGSSAEDGPLGGEPRNEVCRAQMAKSLFSTNQHFFRGEPDCHYFCEQL